MVTFTVEEALELDSSGWIVGSSIESRSGWMKWLHDFYPSTYDELLNKEHERVIRANKLWEGIDRTSERYFEVIKQWPIKK